MSGTCSGFTAFCYTQGGFGGEVSSKVNPKAHRACGGQGGSAAVKSTVRGPRCEGDMRTRRQESAL